NGTPSEILVSETDHSGVLRIAKLFQKDLNRVSGKEAKLHIDQKVESKNLIIAGTLGKSKLIDDLIASGKINISQLKDAWEKFLIIPVKAPFPGVENALVITGSDK